MKTIRGIFLGLFVLSTLGVFLFMVLFQNTRSLPIIPTPTAQTANAPSAGDPNTAPPVKNSSDVNFTALIGSIITSVTSLVGLITTTAITWRKEKREAALADVERKKLELELERNKFELKELKQSKGKKKTKGKK